MHHRAVNRGFIMLGWACAALPTLSVIGLVLAVLDFSGLDKVIEKLIDKGLLESRKALDIRIERATSSASSIVIGLTHFAVFAGILSLALLIPIYVLPNLPFDIPAQIQALGIPVSSATVSFALALAMQLVAFAYFGGIADKFTAAVLAATWAILACAYLVAHAINMPPGRTLGTVGLLGTVSSELLSRYAC